jgi:cold shock CspA family protein
MNGKSNHSLHNGTNGHQLDGNQSSKPKTSVASTAANAPKQTSLFNGTRNQSNQSNKNQRLNSSFDSSKNWIFADWKLDPKDELIDVPSSLSLSFAMPPGDVFAIPRNSLQSLCDEILTAVSDGESETQFCWSCSSKMLPHANYCEECGVMSDENPQLLQEETQADMKDLKSSNHECPPDFYEGTVKSFSQKSGWGFIQLSKNNAASGDVLFHRADVCGSGASKLRPGLVVHCRVISTDKGQKAKEIAILENQEML